MGAAAFRFHRDAECEKFVGQVLDRASPILEFKTGAKAAPNGAASTKSRHRDPAESAVRVSRRPTLRLPVVPRLVRHTRIGFNLVAIAHKRPVASIAQRLAHGAIALAAGLVIIAVGVVVTNLRPSAGVTIGAVVSTSVEKVPNAHVADDEFPEMLLQGAPLLELPATASPHMSTIAKATPRAPAAKHPATRGGQPQKKGPPRIAPRHRTHATHAPPAARHPRPAPKR